MSKQVKSEYDIQAETFLQEAGITFKAVFLFHGPHQEGDKDFRDVYNCVLERKGKEILSVKFGQSIINSSKWYLSLRGHTHRHESAFSSIPQTPFPRNTPNKLALNRGYHWRQTEVKPPSAYDLLSCLQKYDPGSFENFCGDFGYDTDSRKAEKIYFAVQEEWNKVRRFFSPEEIEKLQDIN